MPKLARGCGNDLSAVEFGCLGGGGDCLGERTRQGRTVRVIGAVDGLNKVLISRAELEQAIRRLCGAGLLTVEGETFRLTAAGEALIGPVEDGKEFSGIFTRLIQVPFAEVEWNLAHEVYEAAAGGLPGAMAPI